MREIKFRAWDEREQRMLDGNVEEGRDIGDGGARGLNKQIKWAENSSFKLMQFTGSNDRNNKEIFEGDIVKWEPLGVSGEVYFDKGGFKVRNYYCAYQDVPDDAFGEGLVTLEVIGNIYQNPELLTK